MKHVFISISIFLLSINCGFGQKNKIFIPEEYHVSYDNVGHGIIKVYQNIGNAQQFLNIVRAKSISYKKYFYTSTYVAGQVVDSSVYTNSTLVEIYSFENGKMVKGHIQEDTIIDNGKRYGRHIRTLVFKQNSSIITSRLEEEYDKDVNIDWQGKVTACILTKAHGLEVNQNNNFTFLKKERKTEHLFYYAKGLGLIKIINIEGNNTNTIVLKEIKRLND